MATFHFDRCGICGIERRLIYSPNCPHLPYEPGADGLPQAVLPGAERASEAEVARLRNSAPLKPAKPQKPCDHGLFSDDANQQEMFK